MAGSGEEGEHGGAVWCGAAQGRRQLPALWRGAGWKTTITGAAGSAVR